MNRSTPAFALAGLLALSTVRPAAADTTVIAVRHAEKIDASADPLLSPDGRERARVLRDMLRDVPLTALYSTKYHRTMDTLAPTAEAHTLEITVRGADMDSLAAEILGRHKDGTVLVAGHSNTVPALIRALGVKEEIEIVDSEYDHLFLVTIDDDGKPTLLHLRYGY